jgi:hypothetical protein
MLLICGTCNLSPTKTHNLDHPDFSFFFEFFGYEGISSTANMYSIMSGKGATIIATNKYKELIGTSKSIANKQANIKDATICV